MPEALYSVEGAGVAGDGVGATVVLGVGATVGAGVAGAGVGVGNSVILGVAGAELALGAGVVVRAAHVRVASRFSMIETSAKPPGHVRVTDAPG
jgi:hypothetical protein